MAEYPGSAYTPNPQDTSNDLPGNTQVANGADYNKHDEEIQAISGDLRAAFSVEGAASIEAMTTAVLGGFSDGTVWLGATRWVQSDIPGNWSRGKVAGVPVLELTPASNVHSLFCDIGAIVRAASSKGFQLTSVDFIYNNVVAFDVDVYLTLARLTLNGNGSAPTAGLISATHDANHDTPAKRIAAGQHTATLTVDTPAFEAPGANGVGLYLLAEFEDSSGTGDAVFYGAQAHFTQALVDGA